MKKIQVLEVLEKKMPDIEYEFVLDEHREYITGNGFYAELRPWCNEDIGR